MRDVEGDDKPRQANTDDNDQLREAHYDQLPQHETAVAGSEPGTVKACDHGFQYGRCPEGC